MGWWKKIKAWHIALAVVASCGIGGLGASWFVTYRAKNEVQAAKARLHTLGYPVSTDELVQNIPDDQNAGPLYRQASEYVHAMKIKEGNFLIPQTNEVDYDAMAAYVKAMETTMGMVERAAQQPECYFSRPWKNGWRVLFPEFADFKRYVKVTSYRARLATRNHDYRAALKANALGLRIAQQADEPFLIGLLVGVACQAIVLAELDKEIVAFGDIPEFRQEAMRLLDGLPPLPAISRAFSYEIPLQVTMFDQLGGPTFWKDMYGNENPSGWIKYYSRFEFIRQSALAKCLTWQADALEKMKAAPNNWHLADQALDEMDRKQTTDQSLAAKVVQFVSPSFTQIGQAVGRLDANRQLARTALMLYDYKAKNGKFPTLIPPNFPADPFGKGPFVYDRSGNRFFLYSVGPNGRDNGGKPIYASNQHVPSGASSDDVEFMVARPE